MISVVTKPEADRLYRRYGDKLHVDYSGRGMCGKTCIGYSGDNLVEFALDLARALVDENDDFDAAVRYLGSPSRDALGLDTIHYWPGIVPDAEIDPEDYE